MSIQSINFDIGEIPVHFGKHKGKKLSEVPKEYLFYMITEFSDDGPWKKRAVLELERRKNSPQAVAEKTGQPPPECLVSAVEQLSKTKLIREFITRTDRDQGIFSWAQEFSREVRRLGSKKNSRTWHYIGHGFGFDKYDEHTSCLVSVWVLPDGE